MNMMLPNYVALFENAPYPQGIGNSLGKLMSFFGFSVTCKAKPMGKKLWFLLGVLGRIRLLNGDQIHQAKILATFFVGSLPRDSLCQCPQPNMEFVTPAPKDRLQPMRCLQRWLHADLGIHLSVGFWELGLQYQGRSRFGTANIWALENWGVLEKNHKNRRFNMI